jgi:hypothetical protein
MHRRIRVILDEAGESNAPSCRESLVSDYCYDDDDDDEDDYHYYLILVTPSAAEALRNVVALSYRKMITSTGHEFFARTMPTEGKASTDESQTYMCVRV